MFIEIEPGIFIPLDRIVSFGASPVNPNLTVVRTETDFYYLYEPVANVVRRMRGSGVTVHAHPQPDNAFLPPPGGGFGEPRRSHA